MFENMSPWEVVTHHNKMFNSSSFLLSFSDNANSSALAWVIPQLLCIVRINIIVFFLFMIIFAIKLAKKRDMK